MNGINNISDRQNELDLLKIQFCARHLYSLATLLNYFSWLCSISTTIVLPLLSDKLGWWKYVIVTIINVIALVINNCSSKFVKTGAAFKMLFDYKLYQFPECESYQGYSKEHLKQEAAKVIHGHQKDYNEAISHNGTDKPNGVRDWYVNISKNIEHDEAVNKCQKQNCFFEKEIMKITWRVFVGFLVLLIILFVMCNFNSNVSDAVLSILSLFALIIKITKEIDYFVRIYSIYYFEDNIMNASNISLLTKQKIIDDRRILNIITPNIIYKMKSFKLHSLLNVEEELHI